jgi:hypothetical protein
MPASPSAFFRCPRASRFTFIPSNKLFGKSKVDPQSLENTDLREFCRARRRMH